MTSKAARQILKIDGSLNVSEAAIIMNVLVAHFDLMDGFNLDLSEVEECDNAGIQLLIALQKFFGKSGKPLVFANASDAVRNALYRSGTDPGRVLKNIRDI